VRVGTVALSGEITAPGRAERLRARLETRPPGFLEPGRFRQDVLDRDLAGILTALHAEGFADAKVGPAELVFAAERRRVDVTIPIVEGPRLVAGEVSVEGHTVVDTADLLRAVPLQPGEPFSAARAEQGRRAIEQLYAQRGYHAARVEVDTARGDGTVTARYRIREGEGTRIGRILLRGLVLTREDTVLGQVDLEPGAPFDPGRLVEAQRRLSRAPALVATQVGPLRPEPRPFADAEITVSEPKPWRLEAEAGYDSAEGARGRLGVGHDNLFGTARRLSVGHKEAIGGQSVSRLQRAEMTYEEPWLGRTSWQGALNLFAERTENIGYDLDRFGLSVLVGEDLAGADPARGLRSRLRYRLEQVERSNVSADLKATGIQAAENRVASLTPSLAWDLRDDRFEPSRGSAHTLSLEVASLVFGSEVGFAKGEVGTSWFASLKPLVFALSGRLGLAAPLIDDDEIPIEDRFFTGGATSVRGYREDRVGPLDADQKPLGGNALVVLNAEVRFPVWGWLRGALFVDSGAVTPEVSDLSLDAFRTGVGLGLRLSTPVGPIRLDVGYALDPIPGEDRLQFYLTVGHAF
jgi:outer membrane protein insertion porin family